MVATINVQPQTLNLALYAGDGVSFRILCTDAAGDPVDVTGAIEAQVRLTRLTDDPPLAEFAASMVDAYQGIVVLSLTGDQTKELSDSVEDGNFKGVWDLQWVPASSEPRTLCQGSVECVSDVTR